jgi:hypothetical protein
MIKEGKDGSPQANIKGLSGYHATYCHLVLCDEDGDRIFTANDIDRLGAKSSKVLDRIVDEGKKFTGIDSDDAEQDAENFSEATTETDDSGSN